MVHLHTRSCYSLLESSNRIQDIVQRNLELGFRHACITDHNSMYGTMQFYKLCQKNHIHPIIGLEVDVYHEQEDFGFVCLAKNDEGLKNLYKLSSYIMTQKEVVSMELFFQYTEHCVVLTSGNNDTLDQYCAHDDEESMIRFLSYCKEHISDFYVSIAMNDSRYRMDKNKFLKRVSQSLHISTVALSRIYYSKKEDVNSLRILQAISKQKLFNDQTLDVTNDRYFRSKEEMQALYDEDDLLMTEKIASMCNVQMAFEKNTLPHFKNKLGIDSKEYLIKLCKKGLWKRLNGKDNPVYTKRLEYELSVITSMGFTDYFLIVWDFIRYARSQNIYVGCGRGSAAGSLVSYCLGITHIDPIQNHLLFERFLNPERISMPDIDTDFPDDRRDEVIDYVTQKYGIGHVAHIVTFNTLKAKQVLRDVGRVFSIANHKIDLLTKAIGNTPKITLMQAYQEIPNFARMVESDSDLKKLFEACLPLEGLPRHLSLHAAGIVISEQEITNVCPLVDVDENIVATQFTMEYLEELGLIKMDFLSIRNLTTIYGIVNTLKEKENIDINILKLPLNDAKTFQLLSRGDTLGVFQLESQGIKQLLQKMKPNKFEDICAVLALYRPGPMKNIDMYIERKNDPSKITYVDARLKPILQETYGIMVYQEQIMQIAQVIGGFTLAQADMLRKAMSKKDKESMNSYREQFMQGALQNHCSFSAAKEIFETMERFAEYGFNKSHSYAYGMTCYQMAYLKANYPLYFYQRLFDSVIGSETKTAQYLYECQHRGLKILPVDINCSMAQYSIENGSLRMPFQVLKGIGKSVYPHILEARGNALFKDLVECISRLTAIKISESNLNILIDGGAFDGFGWNRASIRYNLKNILDYAHLIITENVDKTLFKWDLVDMPKLVSVKEDVMERSKREHQVYGFYISEHPVQMIRKKYPNCIPLIRLEKVNGYVQAIGRIVSFRTHKTKKGDWMCFISLEDEEGKVDLAIMPYLYQANKEQIQKDRIVHVQGKKDRPQSILVQKIEWVQ